MDSQGCQPNGWASDDFGEGPSQPHHHNPPTSDRNLVYCASCDCFVAEPWLCIGSHHFVPSFNADWDCEQPVGVLQSYDTTSPLVTQSTMYSEASNTGSSYYPQLEAPMAGYHDYDYMTDPSTGTDWTRATQNTDVICDNNIGLPIEQHLTPELTHDRASALDSSGFSGQLPDCKPPQVYLSSNQIDTLERFGQRWITQNHNPTNAEIESIALLEQLSPEVVTAWFHARLQDSTTASTSASTGSSKGKQKVQQAHGLEKPSQTVAEVRQWARKKFYKPCSRAQIQNSPTDLPFKCTSGCGYSTDKIDAWRRHEMGWQPQHFWHCVRCRSNGASPFICARKDKFRDHLKAAHNDVVKELHDSLRNSSEVTDAIGCERQCKFVDALGRPCPTTFQTWEERLQHYLAHFRSQISYGPWNLLYGRHKWFDDDDPDEQGGTGGHTSPASPNAKGPPAASSGGSGASTESTGYDQQQHGQRRHAAPVATNEQTRPLAAGTPLLSDVRCRECSTQQPTRPTLLIHVSTAQLVEPPINAKYLALDHTWAAESPASRVLGSETFRAATGLLLTDDRLPIPLEQLRAFAHGIGYCYLWIAEICEPQSRSCVLRSIQERASLHMVSVRCPERPQSLLHFACRSSHVREIHEWANQRGTISHVRNLGHGSYGIVDEVKVNPGQQVLARKELSTSRLQSRPGDAKLQEVLIMQRLSHPHISHSKSAYYDHTTRSWNILMTPVAEGTLRDYMAEPGRWPERRRHIATWYICLAAALEYMHQSSCRHKDIKPANILVSGQDVLLTDFGTSHDFSTEDDACAEESGTEGHALMTPRYSAPEVAAKARRGRKADVFSLGCVYAEMLTTELGHTLEEMHRSCGMSGKRRATYAGHLRQLHRWLELLNREVTSVRHNRIIAICKSMTSAAEEKRPLSSTVLDHIAGYPEDDPMPATRRCSCLDRRASPATVLRHFLDAKTLPLMEVGSNLLQPHRQRSGRGRRCRSRVVRPSPLPDVNDERNTYQQIWFYRPVPAYRSSKWSSVILNFAICSFAASGNFFGLYLDTQITYTSMTISIILSQGMHTMNGVKADVIKTRNSHDHKRFKKLYWKALCIVRVVASSHHGTETQLMDRKCVTRTHGELMILPSMSRYFDTMIMGNLISLWTQAMNYRFEGQIRAIAAAIASAEASLLPAVELQGLLC